MPDDGNLENRLRELLRDPRWSLRPWPDAQARVRRSARRQRIKAASLAAGIGAIAVAAVAVPLTLPGGVQGTPVPSTHASTPSAQHHNAATVRMPMVVGQELREAEAAIRAAVPIPDIIVRPVKTPAPPGTVVVQIPAAGTSVAPGSQITLKESNGS